MGGTLSKYVAAGSAARIVSLTAGEAGQIRDVTTGPRRTLGQVRTAELREAAAVLGVTDTICLDHGDGTLQHQPKDALVEVARGLIDDFAADVVISFGPDGGTGHPDHVAVSEIATEAAASSTSQPAMLHAVFPQHGQLLVELLVDWLDSLDERFRGTEAFAHALMLFADGSSMLGYAADHMDIRFYPAGTFIIEQGEPAGELFLVLSGAFDIIREDDDGQLSRLATSGAGGFVGEDGIARGQARNAHVVAKTSVTCFVLSPGARNPTSARGASPLAPTHVRPIATSPSTEGCITVDVKSFARQKIRALSCHRSQYPLEHDMFPDSLVEALFGVEYFDQVAGS